LISFTLARLGLVTAHQLLRWLPYSVLAAFILAALITPPDGVSQVLVAVPMLVLYLIGVAVAALAGRRG
jgi:sec-independent protein translocase protein TatC